MATTPEGKVKASINKLLERYGAYRFMPVQNGLGAPGLDYHCCYYGVAFFIEAKAPGKKPTKRQVQTMARIGRAGGKCFVIDGPQGLDDLDQWLTLVALANAGNHGITNNSVQDQ